MSRLGLDLEKVKDVQSSLDGIAERGLLKAVEEFLSSNGNNWVATNTLRQLGVLIPKVVTGEKNVSTTDETVQLNS